MLDFEKESDKNIAVQLPFDAPPLKTAFHARRLKTVHKTYRSSWSPSRSGNVTGYSLYHVYRGMNWTMAHDSRRLPSCTHSLNIKYWAVSSVNFKGSTTSQTYGCVRKILEHYFVIAKKGEGRQFRIIFLLWGKVLHWNQNASAALRIHVHTVIWYRYLYERP